MLKHVVASIVLIVGVSVSALPALAAPDNDAPPPKPYNTEDPARIRQEMDRPRAPDTNTTAPVEERAPRTYRSVDAPPRECADCPPPKRYDSTEVIKTSQDVDHSRVIDTDEVVQTRPRVKEINKLVIRENETRNVGVVQHNHRIIEKETRYVKRAPVYRHPAPPVRVRVQTVYVPIVMPPVQSCGCPCTCSGSHGGYGQAYVYEQVPAYDTRRVAVQQVYVPVNVPAGYGYR